MIETKNFLKSLFTEHWKYLAISTACKLNIFDALEKGSSVFDLSKKLNLHEASLKILLSALVQIDFLEIHENDFYKLNQNSLLLTEKHPQSLKYACMNWSDEHLIAFNNLSYSIQTGNSAFEKIYGNNYFDYLNLNPEKLDNYHKAMFQYAQDDYENIASIIDFSVHKSIMDIGGGYGALIQAIKSKNPSLECILFDLPQVIENVYLANIVKKSGSFFDSLPSNIDAFILSRILHDWNDEKALEILNNVFKALPEKGILYVIENCADKINIDLSLLSLNMLAMCQSYERNSKEYIALCEKIGLKFKESKPLNTLQTILIFEK